MAQSVRKYRLIASAALAGCSLLFFGHVPAQAGDPPAGADEPVAIEVVGTGASLPTAHIVPDNDASKAAAKRVSELVAMTGLYRAHLAKPGTKLGGLVVRVVATKDGSRTRWEATSTNLKGDESRRGVSFLPKEKDMDEARLADAVIKDLSGTRSHLSGELLFTDASKPGLRQVVAMLATGARVRTLSPPKLTARGADRGPGGRIYYAAAKRGHLFRIFQEGHRTPERVKAKGHLQSVAFSQDGREAAVVVGSAMGGDIYRGVLGATMKRVATGKGVAIGASFGPNGELAYASGPTQGPLSVFVDGKRLSPKGAWASAPTYCGKTNKVAYMVKAGRMWTSLIQDTKSKLLQPMGRGAYPACSPDGRSVALARKKRGRHLAGIFVVGPGALGVSQVRVGKAIQIRWASGAALPPSG